VRIFPGSRLYRLPFISAICAFTACFMITSVCHRSWPTGGIALAAVTSTLPLTSPCFSNAWQKDVEKWRQILSTYTAGNLAKAAELLRELALTPRAEAALAWKNLAIVYKDMGQPREAAQAYAEALRIHPEDAGLWADYAWALYASAQIEPAIAAFERAIGLAGEEPWLLYGLGLAYAGTAAEVGIPFIEKAISLNPRLAAAHFDLGLLYAGIGWEDKAAEAFAAALAADSNYTAAYGYLAPYFERKGDLAAAWNAYSRGVLALPADTQLQKGKQLFQDTYRDFIAQREAQANIDRHSVKPKTIVPLHIPKAPEVRVGLLERMHTIRLAWGRPVKVYHGNQVVAELPAGGIWTLRYKNNGRLILENPDGRLVLSGSAPWTLVPESDDSTFVVYDMEVNKGTFYAKLEHRQYRGRMEIAVYNQAITLINIVDLESYLLSVVPSEMYASMPQAALQVQAVAARTYTLRHMGRYAARGFDLLGTPASAEYRGAGAEHPQTTAAVLATVGQVLVDEQGRLAETYYSACSGGHTVSAAEIWGGERSYLTGVLDSDEEEVPEFPLGPAALECWIKKSPLVFSSRTRFTSESSFRWVKLVDPAEIERRVNERRFIGRLQRVVTGARGIGGQVSEVHLVGTEGTYTVRGDSIRSMLGGLRSNLIKVEGFYDRSGNLKKLTIFGGGFGHGVGMDQLGATGMAEAGYDMEAIISHYYGSARLKRLYE
jgi:stage II sporulation protein D